VEDFLAGQERVLRLESNVLRPEALEPPVIAVPKCPAGK